MTKTYQAVNGQSLLDICLQVYGDLNLLLKMIQDSGIDNVNVTPFTGQKMIYDDQLVNSTQTVNQFILSKTIYATDMGDNGNVYYIINQPIPPKVVPGTPVATPITSSKNMYKETAGTSFTSNADGTTVITPLDKDGLAMTGYAIVQLEKEILPLTASQFVWDTANNRITLIGTTLDNGQTLFILYSKTINP